MVDLPRIEPSAPAHAVRAPKPTRKTARDPHRKRERKPAREREDKGEDEPAHSDEEEDPTTGTSIDVRV